MEIHFYLEDGEWIGCAGYADDLSEAEKVTVRENAAAEKKFQAMSEKEKKENEISAHHQHKMLMEAEVGIAQTEREERENPKPVDPSERKPFEAPAQRPANSVTVSSLEEFWSFDPFADENQ